MPVDNLIPNMQAVPLYQRYIGNALPEEKQAMDRIETQAAKVDYLYDQIDAATKQAQAAPFAKDQAYLGEAKRAAAAALKMAHERGDYENLDKAAKLAASEFQKYYVPIAQNHKALQEAVTKEMDAENGYSPEEKSKWLAHQKEEYEKRGGLQIDPVTGQANNFFTGERLNKRINFGKEVIEITDKLKPTDLVIDRKNNLVTGIDMGNGTIIPVNGIPATYLLQHNEITGVLKDRIRQIVKGYLDNTPEYKAQTKIEATIAAQGLPTKVLDDWQAALPEKAKKIYLDALKTEGNSNPTSKDIYLKGLEIKKTEGLIGAAEGMQYTNTKRHDQIIHNQVAINEAKRKADKIDLNGLTLALSKGTYSVTDAFSNINQSKTRLESSLNQAKGVEKSQKDILYQILAKFGQGTLTAEMSSADLKNLLNKGAITEDEYKTCAKAHDNLVEARRTIGSVQNKLENVKTIESQLDEAIDYDKLKKEENSIKSAGFVIMNTESDIKDAKAAGLLDADGHLDVKHLSFDKYLDFWNRKEKGYVDVNNPAKKEQLLKSFNYGVDMLKSKNILKPIDLAKHEFTNIDKNSDVGMANNTMTEAVKNNWHNLSVEGMSLPTFMVQNGVLDENGQPVRLDASDIKDLKLENVSLSSQKNKVNFNFSLKDKGIYSVAVNTKGEDGTDSGLGALKLNSMKQALLNSSSETLKGENLNHTSSLLAQSIAVEAIDELEFLRLDSKKDKFVLNSDNSGKTYTLLKDNTVPYTKWNLFVTDKEGQMQPLKSVKTESDLKQEIGLIEVHF